jgi:predicted membrane chloride channel (bestrophin family)
MENQMPSTRHEGGARIPTIEEAYAVQEKQFYAQRKAEFDAILEKASLQEQREIEQAKEVIKQEVKRLAKMNVQMNEKLLTLQQMTLDQSEKKGVYYVRFMELMTELVRTLVAQVSESNTWLEAMISKKKKRGSLFAARSKNQGTQYSMSQELSIARSTN